VTMGIGAVVIFGTDVDPYARSVECVETGAVDLGDAVSGKGNEVVVGITGWKRGIQGWCIEWEC
jgi:hypothetical protein